MKIIRNLILTICFITSSCVNYGIYEEPANIILQNYGGEIAFGPGVGVGIGSKGNKYDYLSVELSNSLILKYGISPTYVIHHIAAEFAKVIPENISEIQVKLSSLPTDNGNQNFSETISVKEAKLIIQKENILHNCITKIALNDNNALTSLFTEEFKIAFKENNTELTVKKINEFIGNYEGSKFRGYNIMKSDSIPDKEFILLNGIILGSNQNANVSVIIDPDKPNNKSIIELIF